MKTVRDSFNVESTMIGSTVAMGIRSEDTVHLMGLLTDLYKDRLLAILREYTTNAADAHVDAGINLPIEVTLPSDFNPVLVVRDYGSGLDWNDIREVYSQYGRSTKRGTDEQGGMLGIGCKSALSYGNQFTVTSVKNGLRFNVLVSRDEEGAGMMQNLGSEEGDATEDASGTTIQIAIRREDIHRCRQLADEFFSYWPVGSVLVNGKQPERFKGLKINDSIFVIDRPNLDKVVMANVAYPTKYDLGTTRGYSVVAFVPIGSVIPTPAREGLRDVKRTEATLAQVVKDFRAAIDGAIQKAVDLAPTPQDALRTIVEWDRYITGNKESKYTYRGTPIPQAYKEQDEFGRDKLIRTTNYVTTGYYDKPNSVNTTYRITSGVWPTTVWVSNYDIKTFTGTHKRKLKKWVMDEGLPNVKMFVLLDGDAPKSPFIDPAMCVEWSVIRAVKLDPNPNAGSAGSWKTIPGSYAVYTENGYISELSGSDIRQDKPIFWNRGNRWQNSGWYEGLKNAYKEFTLVCLPANRVEKFKRDVPAAKLANDGLRDTYAKWFASLDPDDVRAVVFQELGHARQYEYIDPNRVLDPEIKQHVVLAEKDVNKIIQQRKSYRQLLGKDDFDKAGSSFKNPLSRYPLFDRYKITAGGRQAAHMYIYLNAAYVEDQKKKP